MVSLSSKVASDLAHGILFAPDFKSVPREEFSLPEVDNDRTLGKNYGIRKVWLKTWPEEKSRYAALGVKIYGVRHNTLESLPNPAFVASLFSGAGQDIPLGRYMDIENPITLLTYLIKDGNLGVDHDTLKIENAVSRIPSGCLEGVVDAYRNPLPLRHDTPSDDEYLGIFASLFYKRISEKYRKATWQDG